MRRISLSAGLLLLVKLLLSQCQANDHVFKVGEKASYDVYYKLGPMWFHAAEANFQVKQASINQTPVYHFVSSGKTLANYDWLFKVRDVFQSKADSASLSPLWFSRDTYEGGYEVNNSYRFDYTKRLIYSDIKNSKQDRFLDTIKMQDGILDVLTAIYVCRNIDFSKLKLNDTVPLKMVIDNEVYPLFIRYLGNEQIGIKDERKFNCVKFSILLVEGTIFRGGEDMTVWVSNDEVSVPIKVEANILIGSVVVHLNQVSGLRFPMSAEIKSMTPKN